MKMATTKEEGAEERIEDRKVIRNNFLRTKIFTTFGSVTARLCGKLKVELIISMKFRPVSF